MKPSDQGKGKAKEGQALTRTQARLIRLLRLLQLLHREGVVGERLLCKRLQISRATLYRDLKLLREAGLQIPKRPEGFALEGFDLSAEEAKVLQLALSALQSLTEIPYERAFQALLARFGVAQARVRILENPRTKMTPARRRKFRLLEELIQAGQGCLLHYRLPGRPVWLVEAYPRYLLFKRRAWYVLALSPWDQGYRPRLYRLNRIERIEPLGKRVPAPAWGLNPEGYFENAWEFRGRERTQRVVLKIHSERARDLIEEVEWHPTQWVGKRGGEGEWVFRVEVADPEEMIPWILQFGAGVEVVEPEELRLKVQQEARALLERYGVSD